MPFSNHLMGTVGALYVAFAATLFLPTTAAGQTASASIKSVESDTDRWIQLQSKLSQAQSAWKSEKALLEGSIALLETEQSTLTTNLDSNRQASQVFEANRDRLAARVAEHREALSALETPMSQIESGVRELLPRLPPPLQQEVSAYLAKLEQSESGVPASLATRAQSLVSICAAIDRFSNSLTTARVARPGLDSGEISVRVIYWGLAGGYGVDDANGRAWVIAPSSSGWNWEQRDEIYEPVFELIRSYEEENYAPSLITLPAAID